MHRCSIFLAVLVAGTAFAETRAVSLHVPGMTCSLCPATIRTALKRVDGVERLEVDLEARTVRVWFDDARATPQRLVEATRAAGYPSIVREEAP